MEIKTLIYVVIVMIYGCIKDCVCHGNWHVDSKSSVAVYCIKQLLETYSYLFAIQEFVSQCHTTDKKQCTAE